MVKAQYTVSLYASQYEAALNKFRAYFWPESESFTKNPNTLDQRIAVEEADAENRAPTFLVLKENEVIGHVGSLPVSLWTGMKPVPAHWVVGFMVLPEYRNGLIGPCLIKKVNETLDLAMSLHVEDTVLRILKGLGWQHAGVIPQYMHVLNGYRVLKNVRIQQLKFLHERGGIWSRGLQYLAPKHLTQLVAGALARLAVRSWLLATFFVRRSRRDLCVAEEHEFDGSYSVLWDRVASKFDALVVRDQAYLQHRYGERLKDHRLLACREKGALQAFCILKVRQFEGDPRMGWIRMATIVDCLFDPDNPDALQALITASIHRLRCDEVDVIFCTASHRIVQGLLTRNAFIKLPGNLNFAYYDRRHVTVSDTPLHFWHLMRGDSDAAENF